MIEFIELGSLTPYLAGRKHGERAKEAIKKNISTTYDRFKRLGIEIRKAKAEAILWAKKCSTEYLTECYGVSIGSGVDIIDIYLINFRIEIAQPHQAYQLKQIKTDISNVGVPECTLFSIRNESGVLIASGQNLDGLASVQNCLIVTKKTKVDGNAILSVQEAGVVGTSIGVSTYGFSIVYAGLIMESCIAPRDGIPVRAFFYEVLKKTSFSDVLSYLASSFPPCAVSAILTSKKENKVIVTEFLGEGVSIRHSDIRIETHANHATMPSNSKSLFERHLPDSIAREKRLKCLLSKEKNICVSHIQKALSDHENYPTSICLHPKDSVIQEKKAATLCSAIIDWENLFFHVSNNQPCKNDWAIFNI